MKNIFVEGIQGMKKSALLQEIFTRLPETRICREGDYSSVELAGARSFLVQGICLNGPFFRTLQRNLFCFIEVFIFSITIIAFLST